jgi:pyruvate carboxylase
MADAVREAALRQAPPEQVLDDEESHELKNSVHQRLRANSSIMQLRKLLVANRGEVSTPRLSINT